MKWPEISIHHRESRPVPSSPKGAIVPRRSGRPALLRGQCRRAHMVAAAVNTFLWPRSPRERMPANRVSLIRKWPKPQNRTFLSAQPGPFAVWRNDMGCSRPFQMATTDLRSRRGPCLSARTAHQNRLPPPARDFTRNFNFLLRPFFAPGSADSNHHPACAPGPAIRSPVLESPANSSADASRTKTGRFPNALQQQLPTVQFRGHGRFVVHPCRGPISTASAPTGTQFGQPWPKPPGIDCRPPAGCFSAASPTTMAFPSVCYQQSPIVFVCFGFRPARPRILQYKSGARPAPNAQVRYIRSFRANLGAFPASRKQRAPPPALFHPSLVVSCANGMRMKRNSGC